MNILNRKIDASKLTIMLPSGCIVGVGGLFFSSIVAQLYQSGVFCCSMYVLRMAIGAPPQLAAKYEGDHNTPFQ